MVTPFSRTTTRSLSSPKAVARNQAAPWSSNRWPLLAQGVDRALHVAVGGQRAFGEEVVVHHAEAGEVVADVAQAPGQAGIEHAAVAGVAQQLLGAGDQRVDVGFLVAALAFVGRQAVGDLDGAAAQRVAGLGAQAAGDVDHVLALVAVVREAHVHAAQLVVAQPHRHRQDVHLAAGVVDVVLALHGVAGGIEQVGDAGAVGRAAAVADVQRAVRVGRDELDGHRLAASGRPRGRSPCPARTRGGWCPGGSRVPG